MYRFRFSGELALPSFTLGIAFTTYLILMLINLVGIQGQLAPLREPQNLVKSLESGGLRAVSQEFESSRNDIDQLSDDLTPIAWFGQHMHWIPIAGPSARATTNLLGRVSEDLLAFDTMIQAVNGATELFEQQTRRDTTGHTADSAELIEKLNNLKSSGRIL
jgi:hypothetical protein